MRSLTDAPVAHRGQSAGRAIIVPAHIDRLLEALDAGDQACVRETAVVVLA